MEYLNYTIIRHPIWNAYTLKPKKGALPNKLKGLFTKPKIAIEAIDEYNKSKEK